MSRNVIDINFDTKSIIKYFDTIKKPKIVDKYVKRALFRVAILIRKKVIPKTPRDIGGLINSWKTEYKLFTLEAGYDIIYAMYQHQGMRADGTHKIKNRPAGGETYFLKNAVEENYRLTLAIFETELFNMLTTK